MRFFFFILLLGGFLQAQLPEIVPAEHAVYDFLQIQRVAGHLPAYLHETRPMSMGTIVGHLESLKNQDLNESAKHWIQQFESEFQPKSADIETVFNGGKIDIPIQENTKKYLGYKEKDDWRVAIEGIGSTGTRFAQDSVYYLGLSFDVRLKIQGHYKDWFGFYSDTYNGFNLKGKSNATYTKPYWNPNPVYNRVLRYDPELGDLYFVRVANPPEGNYDRTSASMRIEKKPFSVELANERLMLGAGFSEPLVMADGGDYFPFVRFNIETKKTQFTFIHADLNDPSAFSNTPTFVGFSSPERYLAIHRIVLKPNPRFTFGFNEILVYGLTPRKLAYLNPFYPFQTAQQAQWDKGNGLFDIEGTWRPKKGIETFASLLIDDLNFKKVVEEIKSNPNDSQLKWAFQTGIGKNIGTNKLLSAEYTRIEPYTYTHRFSYQGFGYYSYHHNSTSIGHPLPPNSDQYRLNLKVFSPKRLKTDAALYYTRKGQNYFDTNGQFVNIGSDLLAGEQFDFHKPKEFLGGIRDEGMGGKISIEWQPLRDIYLKGLFMYQGWNKKDDDLFIRAILQVDL